MVKFDDLIMAKHPEIREAAVFPAADAAAQKRAAINIDDEGDQNKKQKLSDSVVTTTTDIFTRYSNVENHYNAALCSISKCVSLLTKLPKRPESSSNVKIANDEIVIGSVEHTPCFSPSRAATTAAFATGAGAVPAALFSFGGKEPSYRKREVALVEQQKQKNRKFFVNHYAVKFEPKEEENYTIVQVIPESHPEAIAKASATNTTTSLNIAPAEHDHNFCQVGGTVPVTEEVRQAFTTGHAICTVTTLDNYYNGINPANFHTRRKVSRHLPHNLAGGIHKWELVPLQSKLKSSEQENVWMGGAHALCWMAGYVIKNHPELLQGNNKLVCIVIPSGDPRLDLFHQFGAPGRYKDYINPVKLPFIVPVFAEDTVQFPANLIPHFLANAPEHPGVVPLVTEEEKLERSRAYQRSYNQSDARQCTFRDCERQARFSGMLCSKHHRENGGELPKSTFCFIVECEKRKQHDCLGMCISHYTDWCTEFK